jgi:putative ABC transport system permease protein
MRIPRWLRWRTDSEFEEEIQSHLEIEIGAHLERGLTPEQARRAALRQFGNRTHLKETVRTGDPFFGIQSFARDVIYGFRNLRHSPGFALSAIISLALGIGANTLIFSILNATVLKPLGFPEPDRLAAIWTVPVQKPEDRVTSSVSTYFSFRDRSRPFESIAAYNGAACGVRSLGADRDGAPAERIYGQCVTPSLFPALGIRLQMGRSFLEAEDQVDYVAPVAIISHRLWQRRFGGDRAIIGKTMLLNRVPTTIIGVTPADFTFFGDDGEFFVPLEENGTQVLSRVGGLTIIGRLKPGVSLAQAQPEIDSITAQIAAADPERHQGLGARVESLQRAAVRSVNGQRADSGSADYRTPLLILQGAVAFVLLIGCANVAGLLLARTASRRNEVAVRLALGAGRGRIIRQLIAENLPLAAIGGIVGLLLSWAGLGVFVASAPANLPRLEGVSLDARVLSLTALVILATSVLFTLVPALQASRANLADPLKESSRGSTGDTRRQRARSILVAGQIALALVLLTGAGLMIRSFAHAMDSHLGGDPRNLLTFDFRLPLRDVAKAAGRYRGVGLWEVSPSAAQTFDRVYTRLQSVPGVLSVAAVNTPPFSGQALEMPFLIEGRPTPAPSAAAGVSQQDQQAAHYFAVTPGFFGTMKIPVLRGRDFDGHDIDTAQLVIAINQTLARQFFRNENPIGQRMRLDFVPDERPRQIVAVVGDTATGPLNRDAAPAVYVPQLQQTARFTGPWVYLRTGMSFVVRTAGDPLSVVPGVQRAVAEIDRNTPVAEPRAVTQTLRTQVSNLKLYVLLLGLFGAVAALLAATGIYGVMAYSVAERRREIGIRMALGARAEDVVLMVLQQAAPIAISGLALGLAAALALTHLIKSVLFEVTVTDPATYAVVVLLLLVVAVIASLIPARRATRVDPTVALKYE